LKSGGIEPIRLPAKYPNLNAFAEGLIVDNELEWMIETPITPGTAG